MIKKKLLKGAFLPHFSSYGLGENRMISVVKDKYLGQKKVAKYPPTFLLLTYGHKRPIASEIVCTQ